MPVPVLAAEARAMGAKRGEEVPVGAPADVELDVPDTEGRAEDGALVGAGLLAGGCLGGEAFLLAAAATASSSSQPSP